MKLSSPRSLVSAIIYLWIRSCLGSSTLGGSIEAPVRNIGPSWAASCAQGAAVALRYENCVLLFLRYPSSNIWRPPLPQSNEDLLGLRVAAVPPVTVQFAPSWLSIGPNSLCAMTGLASDVEHLVRVLQKQVDTHWNIYDQRMTTHSMTMAMAETFQESTFGGDRPYGVQCLLVGGDDSDNERIYGFYSVDPSGAWQSWGGATAIGKHAKTVREELAKKRRSDHRPSSLKEALEQIVDCWMETCKVQGINLKSNDDYQVLVLYKPKDETSATVYAVDQNDVQSIIEERRIEAMASQ